MIDLESDGSLTVRPARRVRGEAKLEGDKSVAHRALILASLARGRSVVRNLPSGNDVSRTLQMILELGVDVDLSPDGAVIEGRGLTGWSEPTRMLEAGLSGTTLRLMMGALCGCSFTTVLNGDGGLRSRPMGRVVDPLRKMGAQILGNHGGMQPPIVIEGGRLRGIRYTSPIASAQVKSAVLLAGILARGSTSVVERVPTRDHTENVMQWLGLRVVRNGKAIKVEGGKDTMNGREMDVPGDVSSASFLFAGAALLPDSAVKVVNCLLNPHRLAFVRHLKRMGARISLRGKGISSGEETGEIDVGSGVLIPVDVGLADVAPLIDELPLVGVLSAFAKGRSTLKGAAELRVKETDRIRSVVTNLVRLGAIANEKPDGWVVEGGHPLHGTELDAEGDHRTAMALAVGALAADGETVIRNAGIEKSFPQFPEVMNRLVGR